MVLWIEARHIWGNILDYLQISVIKKMRFVCKGARNMIELYTRFKEYQSAVRSIIEKEEFCSDVRCQQSMIEFAIKHDECAIFGLVFRHFQRNKIFIEEWMLKIFYNAAALQMLIMAPNEKYHALFISHWRFYSKSVLVNYIIDFAQKGEFEVAHKILAAAKRLHDDGIASQGEGKLKEIFIQAVKSNDLDKAKGLWRLIKCDRCKYYLMDRVIYQNREVWIPWLVSLNFTHHDCVTVIERMPRGLETKRRLNEFCLMTKNVRIWDLQDALEALRLNIEAASKPVPFSNNKSNKFNERKPKPRVHIKGQRI